MSRRIRRTEIRIETHEITIIRSGKMRVDPEVLEAAECIDVVSPIDVNLADEPALSRDRNSAHTKQLVQRRA